jgi:hypothetical protein
MIRSGNCRLHPPCGGLEHKIGMLPGSECEARTICIKPESRRISGDPLLIDFGSYLLCRASAI